MHLHFFVLMHFRLGGPMGWMRWTKKQLRLYMCRDLYRQDIQNELSSMDENIAPRVSRLDGMPKARGGVAFSSVEHEAEHREEARERLLRHLKELNEQIEGMENALKPLSDIERSALEWAYMRTFYETDKEIANCFKMPLREFWSLKIGALYKVYVSLNESPRIINLEEWVSREEAKHKRAVRLKEEDRAEKRERRNKTLGEVIRNDWAAAPLDVWEKRAALLRRYDKMIERDAIKHQNSMKQHEKTSVFSWEKHENSLTFNDISHIIGK